MQSEEIRARIDSFPVWHYKFELGEHTTPIRYRALANRHEQRRRYIFEPLLDICGGTLAGKRVLDLGCNAGYWSLQAIDHGADFVLGVDGRQMHVDQANFVFEATGIAPDRYSFVFGDLFHVDLESHGRFDIILCLGLMYHVSKQVDLMEKISAANDDILVIDTDLSAAPGSYLRVKFEDTENPLNAADRALVMVPTKKAMIQIAESFGYSVAVLSPRFDDWTGARRYRQGRRRAFLCARNTPLSRLRYPTEPPRRSPRELGWMFTDLVPQIPRRLRRRRLGPNLDRDDA